MFLFSELTPEEAQANFELYVDGLDRRRRALASLVEQAGGPAEAISMGRDGLTPMWAWFIDTYVTERSAPLTAAGVEIVRHQWFDIPAFDELGDEGTTILSGIAAWMIALIEQSTGRAVPWRLESSRNTNHLNKPLVAVD